MVMFVLSALISIIISAVVLLTVVSVGVKGYAISC